MASKWVALAAVILVAAGPAGAQTATVPLAQPDAVQTQETLDTPIERIAGTANGCALLDKDFPGLREHPMYSSFKHMSLNQIAALSKGQITPAMLAQAQSDLSALGKAPAALPVSATTNTPSP
jgi:hypothetical protein